MRRIAVIVAAIFAALVLVAVIAPNFIPESVYRERIIEAVRTSTGRDLKIAGDIDLAIFPTVRVKASGVSLSNAQGFGADQFASMKQLEAGVKLLPLLSKKVEFTRFILVEPTIALEIDEQGRNNWTFESTKSAHIEDAAPASAPAKREGEGGALEGDVNLGKIELVDGLVTYADRQKGEHWEARDINITVALESLDKPLEVDGAAVWKGHKIALELDADNPRGLTTSAGSALKLNVSSDLFDAKFDGRGASADALSVAGAVDLDVKSVRNLIAWTGEPLAPGDGFGPLKLSGKVSYGDGKAAFDNAKIKFDKIEGEGAVSVNTSSDKPYLKGVLKVDTLDVTPYIATSSGDTKGAAQGDGAAPGAAPAQGGQGWSTAPIDLSGLRAANADFNFEAKTVLINKIKLSDSQVAAQLKNGVLNVDLSKLSLYGGTGLAKVKLDGSGSVPRIATDLNFTGIAIEPLLSDAADFNRLTGTGNLTLNIVSTGASQKAIADNLGGAGALKLTDGAVKGINLAAMVRNVSGAFVTGGSGAQQTDFAELTGTYQITNGILANKDLEMLNPLLRLSGAGTANIGARTVDYTIVPKAVATTEGQGGKTDLGGISVPVKITGSWDNLKFAPDPKALLENALGGLNAAKEGGTDPLKGALKGLIGQPPAAKAPAADAGKAPAGDAAAPADAATPAEKKPEPAPEDPAQKLLKGIMGGQ